MYEILESVLPLYFIYFKSTLLASIVYRSYIILTSFDMIRDRLKNRVGQIAVRMSLKRVRESAVGHLSHFIIVFKPPLPLTSIVFFLYPVEKSHFYLHETCGMRHAACGSLSHAVLSVGRSDSHVR